MAGWKEESDIVLVSRVRLVSSGWRVDGSASRRGEAETLQNARVYARTARSRIDQGSNRNWRRDCLIRRSESRRPSLANRHKGIHHWTSASDLEREVRQR